VHSVSLFFRDAMKLLKLFYPRFLPISRNRIAGADALKKIHSEKCNTAAITPRYLAKDSLL
jgi:hypothetical protein